MPSPERELLQLLLSVNARLRPSFADKPGEVAGVIVGVGEPMPAPIPKLDTTGRPLGYWAADEVTQTDAHTLGRGGSVVGERMIDDDACRTTQMDHA